MSKPEIQGKVALITGASRGLGRAISIKLAALGAKTVINYNQSQEKAQQVAKEIEHLGGEVMLARADVADATAVRNMMKANLRGAFLCAKFALRSMMNLGWGRIINISSLAGLTGNAGQSNYSAAKGGLIAFSKSLARELGPRGITVNAIAPGFIETEMTAVLPEEYQKAILERIPLGRYGKPEDIAGLVAFLTSEQAGYITGQVIGVDGGVI